MSHDGYAAAIYGSIVATAFVGAEFEAHVDARFLTLSLLATMLVLWLAHLWSESVSGGVAGNRGELRAIAAAEWPFVEASLLPVAMLALAWAGAWSRQTGVVLALAAGIVQLAGWGLAAGLRSHERLGRAIVRGVVDAALGLAIVWLEIGIHHL